MATATLDAQLKTQLAKACKICSTLSEGKTFLLAMVKSLNRSNNSNRVERPVDKKNILVAQQVTPSDVAIVIPRVDWTENTTYDEFDPTVDMSTKNFYVYNEENNNVYICVKKGSGALPYCPLCLVHLRLKPVFTERSLQTAMNGDLLLMSPVQIASWSTDR